MTQSEFDKALEASWDSYQEVWDLTGESIRSIYTAGFANGVVAAEELGKGSDTQ